MPYKKRKQKCKQSDGDAGNYVLSYTDKKGKKHSNCHTSKKNMQGQIAAIEAESDSKDSSNLGDSATVITEKNLRKMIREQLKLTILEAKNKLLSENRGKNCDS
jgi:hypothetical protein